MLAGSVYVCVCVGKHFRVITNLKWHRRQCQKERERQRETDEAANRAANEQSFTIFNFAKQIRKRKRMRMRVERILLTFAST